MGLDPKVWLPHFQFVMQTMAISYPKHPNDVSKKKYYDFKESLTEILNLEFKDLLDIEDKGYVEHKELRKKVKKLWLEHRDIKKIAEILLFN